MRVALRSRALCSHLWSSSVAWVFVVFSTSIGCVEAADRLAALRVCRSITEEVQRLACFDREVSVLVDKPAANVLAPQQSFGLPPLVALREEAVRSDLPPPADVLDAKLIAMRVAADGRVVFTLDNGQIWRQLVPGDDLLAKLGETVHLSRGALGSYWLKAASGRNCKVTRAR